MRRVWSVQIGATKRFLRPWEGWKATHWLSKKAPICYPPFPVSVFNTLSHFKLNDARERCTHKMKIWLLLRWLWQYISPNYWSLLKFLVASFPMTSLINALQKLTVKCLSSAKFTTLLDTGLKGIHTVFLSTLKYFFWKWWNINKE